MCNDVDPEIIALVFHECNQNMQKTIARIKAGEFQVEIQRPKNYLDVRVFFAS